jgi:hypothetical protein
MIRLRGHTSNDAGAPRRPEFGRKAKNRLGLRRQLRCYRRNERGGARLARLTAGAASTNKCRVGKACQPWVHTIKELAITASAGGFCHFQAEGFSFPVCRTLRLPSGDSSISARMARRSSVAETTGKRTTSMHPKANKQCRELTLREGLRPHHSHQAGTASNSQARLSSSSIG